MKLSSQSRYQVRSSRFSHISYRIYVLPRVDLSSAMGMRFPYWALVHCLNNNPTYVKVLIHLKGPTNCWGRTHTEQSSGYSRYGCRCWRYTLTLLRSCRLDIVISSATCPFPTFHSYFPLSHTVNDIKDSAEWYEKNVVELLHRVRRIERRHLLYHQAET
jgi:hypothetical protein